MPLQDARLWRAPPASRNFLRLPIGADCSRAQLSENRMASHHLFQSHPFHHAVFMFPATCRDRCLSAFNHSSTSPRQ